MKKTKQAIMCLSVVTLMMSAVSCSSDPTTITGVTYPSDKDSDNATIILNLSAAATRADDEEDTWATDAEKAISKVHIYVFDENDVLEKVALGVTVTSGKSTAIKVSHGLKRVYAISAYNISTSNLTEGSSTVRDLENLTFDSTLGKLISNDGHLMIGSSGQQMVMQTAVSSDASGTEVVPTEVPSSNVFNINMVRATAKAQVKCVAGTANTKDATIGLAVGINFDLSVPSFKACQKNNTMRVVASGDLASSYTEHTAGTCTGYTRMNGDYISAQSAFSADNCCYMPENIVNDPISGNTTFLCVKFTATPKQYFAYDASSDSKLKTAAAPSTPGTFYAVGIADTDAGFVDYALTKNGTSHDFVIFAESSDADSYVAALNNAQTPAVTLSETDSPMRAPVVRTRAAQQFQKFEFTNGNVYYRVNIKEGTSCKVVRNKFYKVEINKVSSLGFCSEASLFPAVPGTKLDQAAESWIQATFDVTPWTGVDQKVEL